ncbi:hypothetical protein [Mycolicibacterium gadium]|uniref:hypothetical protein n=1 Tax=Mycolicibacterium gadium TaxID=1794 RepID=UPI0013D15FB0|nr:hypothetical protein [Mycolicibacterium gadium]
MRGEDREARRRLLALDEGDVAAIGAVSGLAEAWGRTAKISPLELARGTSRGTRALKAQLLRDSRTLARELAMYWTNVIDRVLDNAEEIEDKVGLGTQLAADHLGVPAAQALLACVAASDLDVSDQIAMRLDELTELATQPLQDNSDEDGETVPEIITSVPDPISALQQLIERTLTLRREGVDLAIQLRSAADAAEAGLPTNSVDAIDHWSTAVRAHLESAVTFAVADDLDALHDALASAAEAQSTRLADARKALETIDYLRSQGLDGVVASTLQELGFASVEEAELIARLGYGELGGDAAASAADVDEAAAGDGETDAVATPGVSGDVSDVASENPGAIGSSDEDGESTSVDGPAVPEHASEPPSDGCTPRSPIASDSPQTEAPKFADSDELEDEISINLRAREDGLPDFPWDDSNAPLIADLISDSRYALACHVAAATNESEQRQRLLKLTCAAARCAIPALEVTLPQFIPDDSTIQNFGVDEIRVLLAAALRAGLRLGYPPLGFAGLIDRADLGDSGLGSVVEALADAVQRGRTRENDQSVAAGEQLASLWAELRREAQGLPDRLRLRKLMHHKSSKVLQHLARETETVGRVLAQIVELTGRGIDGAIGPEWEEVERLSDDLLDNGKRDRLISKAEREVSTGPQRRHPIESGARTQLHDELTAVGGFLERVRAARRSILSADDIKGVESAQDLDRAMAQAPAFDAPAKTVGEAALRRLITWRKEASVVPMSESLDEVLDRELLALFEIPRTADGRPARVPTQREVARLLRAVPHSDVVAGHLAKGDIAAARLYIDANGLHGFDDDILQATRESERGYNDALTAAERATARLRSLYKDDLARELSSRIDALHTPPVDRLDLAIADLRSVTVQAEDELSIVRTDLEARARAAEAPDEVEARILELLKQGDEVLALEFLTMVEAGQPLPDVENHHGDDFMEFYPAVVEAAAQAQAEGEDSLKAARKALSAAKQPDDRQLRHGLDGWRTIKSGQRRDRNEFRLGVASVLRMVGLIPRSTDWIREMSRIQRSGYATFRVKASPVDRSYVPELGTQALSSYDVTFVWDKVTPARLFDFIDERARSQPNVIFYFGVLSVRDRAALRSLTLPGRGKGFSPLVIDEAVIAWLSTRPEPGWRFTQRVTLPFTTFNPYTPFAGGEVPDEVFVGRDEERRRIESPTGSMFVYGGRQLGKSALLRRVERLFNDSSPHDGENGPRVGNVAVYIDLKAAGIGEAQEPAALWPLLGERLKKAGVIREKTVRASSAADVTNQVMSWLDAEPDNRLLLLLDEADNFLTVDSNAGGSSTRGAFPVLQALKGLMESSKRRFKPVFAGLHQVQRFHDTSNTPVAHGGEDILIGPLKSSDAYSLVVDPMNALGYAFDNPELVWRMLLITNYQASLVQIVCEALVRHLEARPLPADGGRILVDENDVRAVCDKKAVQDLIAQRFRWTINLDSRYRVIALVVAMRSRAINQPASAYSIDDLREDCETFWQQGFSRDTLSRKEFERYLNEMVGLGVLHRQGDLFGLRSPNIVRMLGSKDALDQELQDASLHLESAFEYNPTMARQVIGDAAGFWSPRSPLTDHDLAQLLADDDQHRIRFVVGSEALGIERAAAVIAKAAEIKGIRIIRSDGSDIADLAAQRYGKRAHLVVDLTRLAGGGDLAPLTEPLLNRRNLSATIIAGPRLLSAVGALNVPVVYLRRWSMDGLRAWSESPFDSPLLREKLFRATSGWPKVVEHVMWLVNDRRSTDAALMELARYLDAPEAAQTLVTQSAVDGAVANAWVTWFTTRSQKDGLTESLPVSVADLSEALGRDAEPVLDTLESLDLVTKDNDGWKLDRIVLTAAAKVAT